jgi:hypothetical protein
MTDTAADRYNRAKYDLTKEELHEWYPTGEAKPDDEHPVITEYWGPVIEAATGEATGYVRRIRGRKLTSILKSLNNYLESEGLVVDEYFDVCVSARLGDGRAMEPITEWPEGVVHVMVYAVEGGSEGHYVHIDVRIMGDSYEPPTVRGMFLLKTFLGLRHAQRLANVLTEAFYR